jgi:DNA-binding LytR/AlgR family response regulator
MNKNSYFLFFLSLAFALVVTTLIAYFSFRYVYAISEKELIESRIDANKQEAVHMARLLSQKLRSGYNQQQLINEFQQSIQYTPIDKGFECMFNQQGVQLCHPDPAKIGRMIDSTNSEVSFMNNTQFKENFEQILKQGKPSGGIRSFFHRKYTEIIYVAPVEGSDLMLAVHANLAYINKKLDDFRDKLIFVFLLSGLLTTFVVFVFIRYLFLHMQNRYKGVLEKQLQNNNRPNKQDIAETNREKKKSEAKPVSRLLVNQGNKLVPLLLDDIAYVYIEYKLTYLVKADGQQFTSNLSLDELFEQMNPHRFFRANRQFILSIGSIHKVEKYGNSQLRVKVKPSIDREIIISKLKIAAFKKWLGEQ